MMSWPLTQSLDAVVGVRRRNSTSPNTAAAPALPARAKVRRLTPVPVTAACWPRPDEIHRGIEARELEVGVQEEGRGCTCRRCSTCRCNTCPVRPVPSVLPAGAMTALALLAAPRRSRRRASARA